MSKHRTLFVELEEAVGRSDLVTVRRLLGEGASPMRPISSRGGGPPLLYLALDGPTEIVAELLRAGANPLERLPMSETVLYNTLRTTHRDRPKLAEFEMMRRHLGKSFDALRADPVLLTLAAGAGHIALVRELVSDGRNPDVALASAAVHGRQDVVAFLLDRGAEIDRHGSDRVTPVMAAAMRGHASLTHLLLARGANHALGHLDDSKWTLLHAAASGGLASVIAECLDRGDQVDALTKDDETPIRIAIRGGHTEAVRTLLERGAAVNPSAGKRSTLIGLAYMAKRESLIPILREYGARAPRRRAPGDKTAWGISSALRDPATTTALVVDRIPDDFPFERMPRLKRVKGRVSRWNPSLGRLPLLEKLHLPGGGIEAIGPEIGEFGRLRELLLQGNKLVDLPEDLGNCTALRVLSLHTNLLTALPESLRRLVNVTALHLSENRLKRFPESVTGLGKLTHLCVSRNLFRSLPESIGALRALRELLLSSLRLREIPASISDLRRLEVLDLSYNELGEFPRPLLDNPPPALTKLDLSGNPVRVVPSLESMTKLTKLVLDRTLISALPDLSGCTELTHLNLAGSGLRAIPASIGSLSKLCRLDVSDTPIDRLPESIHGLASLKYVNLNETRVPKSHVDALQESAPWVEIVWHAEDE
ncbi:ankyrin repeat domain-containing protein [Pendulispora brunnea]|uniref:Ankyrin repeat domain-containing protein n=1 Tax=Pendulispora brunnea TaxID=2905690 RepID=A0ABZ2KKC9_9BACT